MASLLKNVASQNVTFCMLIATTGAASTSSSTSDITAYVTKDAVQASAAGTFTSLGPGTGQWNYAPTQSETNATNVGIFVTKTSCIPCNLDYHTEVVDANGFKSVNLVDIAGATVNTASAQLGVNVVNFGATAVTGRDIGASVLLSSGSGTGQLDFTSGVVKANLTQINGAAATSTSSGLGVNVTAFGGTFVTGRDIGASVLLSNGTGSGQISLASGAVTVGTNNDKTGYALTSGERNSVADALLDRDMSVGVDSGSTSVRTPRQAFRAIRNKIDTSGGTLTVYKEDDVTSSWTGAVTVSSAAQPIVTVDPAGP